MKETMGNQKHLLSIHHSNLFRPKPMPITKMDMFNSISLAVVKEYSDDSAKRRVNLIQTFKVTPTQTPKLLITIFDYEQITAIAWLNARHFITVTQEQTINLYNARFGVKAFSMLTDFGPITSLKVILEHNLILTGTEYGYAVVYSFTDDFENFSINFITKMIKVNLKINSIEMFVKAKPKSSDNPTRKTRNSLSRVIPKPGKRKRLSDDDESDVSSTSSSDSDDEIQEVYLGGYDATIFGCQQHEVVAWDFHKRNIKETIMVGKDDIWVNRLLTLGNGDLVTGDSTGTISIFDYKTLTSKYSSNLLDGEILCLASSDNYKRIALSGIEPVVVILKQNSTNKDEYVLFERIDLHTQDVTSLVFSGKKNFLTGSIDGLLGKYRMKGGGPVSLVLDRDITIHNYTNHLKFSAGQMLVQSPNTLVLWKLPKIDPEEDFTSEQLKQLKPCKLLQITTRGYIQTSTISDNLISYSTNKGVNIFIREGDKLISYGTSEDILNCNHLEFCFDNNYLIAAEYDKFHLIDLREMSKAVKLGDYPDKFSSRKCQVIDHKELYFSINQLCYAKTFKTLFVSCSGPNGNVYIIKSDDDSPPKISDCHRYHLKSNAISLVTYNSSNADDDSLYVYTHDDRIIRLKSEIYNQNAAPNEQFKSIKRVDGLPEDSNVLGMIILTDDKCVLYDTANMYKVDLNSNKVLTRNGDYNYIIKVDNSAFDSGNEAALVELTPEDYNWIPVPPGQKKVRRRFGQ